MTPETLTTARLVLDQPTLDDADLITEYCQDPLFERYMSTPWPYEPKHATGFITGVVEPGWASDREYTWALRRDGEFLGVIGVRREQEPGAANFGYWIGGPHRGLGYMREAVDAVIRWCFAHGLRTLKWECVEGNLASMSVARGAGFTYVGSGPAGIPARDGSRPLAWHGVLRATDDRGAKDGWPA
ncbi:GNAT family N-acetyltransferase [Herbiconiux sp. SYSU D00978]|uniref:GNAT family N-acetyltransferase n=1 Tax=Herbiconiux sp. SYSU D00978 TaxID=2812562 RepID=UPI001A9748C5|nr:GNAT family N-acetyltransferase [Herbiconiux sp. SYSU D00978]